MICDHERTSLFMPSAINFMVKPERFNPKVKLQVWGFFFPFTNECGQRFSHAHIQHFNEPKHHKGFPMEDWKGKVKKKKIAYHFLNQELHQCKHWPDEKAIADPRRKRTSSAWPAWGFALADVRGCVPPQSTRISTSSFLIKLYTDHQHFLYLHAHTVMHLFRPFWLLGKGSWSRWLPKTGANQDTIALVWGCTFTVIR